MHGLLLMWLLLLNRQVLLRRLRRGCWLLCLGDDGGKDGGVYQTKEEKRLEDGV